MPQLHSVTWPAPNSWDEFEELTLDIFKVEWQDPHAQRHGRTGQPQHGVDIYGQPADQNGSYCGIQCKRFEKTLLNKAIIEDELSKAADFEPPLSQFVIATTSPRNARVQKTVRQINSSREAKGIFPVHIIFWEDLCSLLVQPSLRHVLRKYYEDIVDSLNTGIDSLELARNFPRDSLKLGDYHAATFPYVHLPVQTAYEHATRTLNAIRDGTSPKQGIIVLGEASSGKSRLAYEVLIQVLADWAVLRWSPATPLADAPSSLVLQSRNLVVFIDDLQEYVRYQLSASAATGSAPGIPYPAMVHELLNRMREHAKRVIIIATCRTENIGSVRGELGYLLSELEEIHLPRFGREDTRAQELIAAFEQEGATHTEDWDGTIGSLVLGLSKKQRIVSNEVWEIGGG